MAIEGINRAFSAVSLGQSGALSPIAASQFSRVEKIEKVDRYSQPSENDAFRQGHLRLQAMNQGVTSSYRRDASHGRPQGTLKEADKIQYNVLPQTLQAGQFSAALHAFAASQWLGSNPSAGDFIGTKNNYPLLYEGKKISLRA
jgi:hypothetical protein